MEQRFKSLLIFEFQARLRDTGSCFSNLAELKWAKGYSCPQGGLGRNCGCSSPNSPQCSWCRYVESSPADTLFHKVKFDSLKAFWTVCFMSTNKKDITSIDLAHKLDLGQKTCWRLNRKVMKAMKGSGSHPITDTAEVDETVFGGQEEGVRDRKNATKKLIVVGIEKRGKGVSRLYTRIIESADSRFFGWFMKDQIGPETRGMSDQWTSYGPLEKDFHNPVGIPSCKKRDGFPALHRVVMNLKGWLRGMHHHMVEYPQDYLDKYGYIFNYSPMKEGYSITLS